MHKHSYFDFLLDKTGGVLKSYLENEDKDPPPWSLCKQFIEKSLAVASSASLAQANTETTLKIYEAQRIWQPLCLAMTVISHLKWDLDAIQKNIPLHLQQILMEELLKGYGILMIPKPDDFDINKYGKTAAMVHIIYNRWVVRTITKYEVLKEKDTLATGLSSVAKETKEMQEQQIFNKVKEYRNLSLEVLEKSLLLESDTEVPFPMPRLVTDKEIIPQVDQNVILKNPEVEVKAADTNCDDGIKMEIPEEKEEPEKEVPKGTIMKVPSLLVESIRVPVKECVAKICFDLGCYYFPKENYDDAWRVFHKAYECIGDNNNRYDWYDTLIGYYEACCLMLDKPRPDSIKGNDLRYRFEECSLNEYKGVEEILLADNLEMKIPLTQRQRLEDNFYRMDKRDSLFVICALNFIRCCLEDSISSYAFFDCLKFASKAELTQFFKYCHNCLKKVTSEELEVRLKSGVRLAFQYLSDEQKIDVKKTNDFKPFLKEVDSNPAKRQCKDMSETKSSSFDESVETSSEQEEIPMGKMFPGVESDERINSIIRLQAKLVSCFNPENIKDVLYELHETNPEQSHCTGYESEMYEEIFTDIEDLLMFDTIHVCVTKSKQLSLQKNYTDAQKILNVCLETLNKYAKRPTTVCPVGRVKNILQHELLWTQLKFAESCPDKANEKETMRRSKACVEYVRQDPPPKPHIYKAIIIYLLNNKEYKFLMDAEKHFDIQIVDFLQLGFHLSAVMSAGKHIDTSQSKGLWESVCKVVGDVIEHETVQPASASTRARGPAEETRMWNLKCYITKEEFVSLLLSLKDDTLLSIMLSCLSSILCIAYGKKEPKVEIKDGRKDMWPTGIDGNVSLTSVQVLSVLEPFCARCLERNPQNLTWLRTIADIYLVKGDYSQAMRHYLEIGSVSTSFFSRPVPQNIYDDKIYRNMIKCCQEQEAYTQVIIFCQFTDPIDYQTAFKAIHQKSSDDGMDTFYDCLWDINIFEYLIYAHNKKGEVEKKKLAIKTLGQPELNCRDSPEILKQSQDIRKTKFLRTLARQYWR